MQCCVSVSVVSTPPSFVSVCNTSSTTRALLTSRLLVAKQMCTVPQLSSHRGSYQHEDDWHIGEQDDTLFWIPGDWNTLPDASGVHELVGWLASWQLEVRDATVNF